jgi:hypothetical protein
MAIVSDEQLALQFLNGCMVKDSNGRIAHRFLNGDEERKAQAALARVLRDRPSASILLKLAALFDAEAADEPRKFVIKNRRRGPQVNSTITHQIAYEIAVGISSGCQLKPAIMLVAERYKVSRASVYRAWKEHGGAWSQIKPSIWDCDIDESQIKPSIWDY